MPNLSTSLPASFFPETRAYFKFVQATVADLSCLLYVRIADKGPRELWGFCRAWAWDVMHEFLRTEGYHPIVDTAAECHRLLCCIVEKQGWAVNSKANVCRLYLLGKAKSFVKGTRLWRPIPVNPKPVLHKSELTTAARAFTTLWRLLICEVLMSF